MTTDTATPTTNETDIDALAKKLSTGDRLLVNDRKNPLVVTRIKVRYPSDYLGSVIHLKGPRGADYKVQEKGSPQIQNKASERWSKITSLTVADSYQFKAGEIFAKEINGKEKIIAVNEVSSEYGSGELVVASFRLTEDGEVMFADKHKESMRRIKPMIFDGDMEKIIDLHVSRSGGHYMDTEKDEEVYLSEPHKSGIDVRPLENHSLEVLRWEDFFRTFEDRFEYIETQ